MAPHTVTHLLRWTIRLGVWLILALIVLSAAMTSESPMTQFHARPHVTETTP